MVKFGIKIHKNIMSEFIFKMTFIVFILIALKFGVKFDNIIIEICNSFKL